MKKYHWINDDVKIDFPVPKSLQELFDEAEKYDLLDDGTYFCYSDQIDVDSKNLYAIGKLTKKQWDIINSRYR